MPPEVVQVGLKEGLNAVSHCFVPLFLQKGPLGLQDLVLLFKESDLEREGCFGMVFLGDVRDILQGFTCWKVGGLSPWGTADNLNTPALFPNSAS